ncbi:GntR family transcriptional regulator [Novosphingobium sp. PhB165]|uniref:GntR family transcriptional regulator n=1 Tax=Novosphingobium sp. PhB165 TaxID=2485105 RepID=UPI00104BFDB6|nr:GntR family transcriptional regulator [Novosphingobium sp. PhB165]TCM20696.1 GntR family transcriptional regulator [Novosphingobium sp. PhB165]
MDDGSDLAGDRVARIIAERIMTGELAAGEPIKQDELAVELGTSRIPVRDALRILEKRGMVSLRANASAKVISRTVEDMDVSYRIREVLEPMLLGESIPNLTREVIEQLRVLKDRLAGPLDYEEYLNLTRDFHILCFSGHKAPLLAHVIEWLWDTTYSYRAAFARMSVVDEGRLRAMCAERELLFDAILQQDIDLAQRIWAIQVRRTHKALLSYAEQQDVSGKAAPVSGAAG